MTYPDGEVVTYLPYGELLVDEHSSSEEMPYKFSTNINVSIKEAIK